MNCAGVRDQLTEHALGILSMRDAAAVDRHLQWCAACRKEAGDLQRATATLAFSAAPADPPAELGDRVVATVRDTAGVGGVGAHRPPRRTRWAAALAAAAFLAVSGLGWGAVMAGRAARFEDRADVATRQSQTALEEFQRLVRSVEFSDPQDQVFMGRLLPTEGGGGGGAAMTLVSPSIIDLAIVMVNGVPPERWDTLPFTVRLTGSQGRRLTVGRIESLDSAGAETISKQFNRDLGGFRRVVVVDARGRVVMAGPLATEAAVASPAP
jgi:hypothetical protein